MQQKSHSGTQLTNRCNYIYDYFLFQNFILNPQCFFNKNYAALFLIKKLQIIYYLYIKYIYKTSQKQKCFTFKRSLIKT